MNLSIQTKYNIIFCIALIIILCFMANILNNQKELQRQINEVKIQKNCPNIIIEKEYKIREPRVEFLNEIYENSL